MFLKNLTYVLASNIINVKMKRCTCVIFFIFAAIYGVLVLHFPEKRILIISKNFADNLRGILKFQRNARFSNIINQKIKTTQKSDKWIVVTTVAQPTEEIKYLARLPGWRVVVVGDTKTPNNWTFQNCDFLSVEQQENLGFQITPFLPVKSYSRKNVGYLYAIANGAKVIYDTDDDTTPLDKLKRFTYSEETTVLMYTGKKNTFNSYRHFGQPSMWPRGYPLSQKGENFSHNYTLVAWKTPLIQQGLVNDPNVSFSVNAPPVVVRKKAYSPFNSQNTLFLYDSFWGLILPTTVSFRVCDIWRSYWAQRLLWEIGGNIAFFPPNAFSKRNPHSYLDDYLQKSDLYFQTENLLTFLSDWTCKEEYSFFECAFDLTFKMVEKGFLGTDDGKLIKLWIDDLKLVNYTEPKRTQVFNIPTDIRTIKGQTADKKNTSIIFIPQVESAKCHSNHSDHKLDTSLKRILHLCPNFNFSRENISYLSSVKTYNILLIIVFNSPFYTNIKYLEGLYRIYFPNIVYCGKNRTLFEHTTRDLTEPVSFIDIETINGYFGQRCMLQAIQMNYNVDGYLHVGDDLILYSKQLERYSLDKILISEVFLLMEDKIPSVPWYWYNTKYGVKAYRNGLTKLKNTNIEAYKRFKENLRINTGFKTGFFHTVSDLVYIPSKYKQDFLFYTDIFTRNNVFLEIVFPTVAAGVTKMENINFFNGTYLWGGERRFALKRIAEKKDFVHPVKMSHLGRTVICERVIKPNLLE